MKKLLLILIPFYILIWGCGSRVSNKGYSIKVKCDKPQKTYTKDLETKVTAKIDSLKKIPKSELEASLETTTVKLAQYSSEGLDHDLFYFRMCQLLNNNHDIDPKDRYKLLESLANKFDEEVKKKNQ